jgi:hypothetical protein
MTVITHVALQVMCVCRGAPLSVICYAVSSFFIVGLVRVVCFSIVICDDVSLFFYRIQIIMLCILLVVSVQVFVIICLFILLLTIIVNIVIIFNNFYVVIIILVFGIICVALVSSVISSS